jgi:hypothetical protein
VDGTGQILDKCVCLARMRDPTSMYYAWITGTTGRVHPLEAMP